MYALIVDDEKRARESIMQIIQLYCPEINQLAEADSVTTAIQSIRQNRPDILFLDIRLGEGTGFDVLKAVEDMALNVVVTTAYDEYAVQAFKYAAIDYLLKPVDPDELMDAVKKAQQKLNNSMLKERINLFLQTMDTQQTGLKRISLTTNENIHIVNIEDIIYCEADRNYTTFHLLGNRKIIVSKNLLEYENLLPDSYFIRTHQSYLVNLNHIIRYEKSDNFLVSVDEQKIPVSIRKKDSLIQFLKKLK